MKRTVLGAAALVLALFAGLGAAQNIRPIRPATAVTGAAPVNATVMDYQAMYNKEVQKNRALKAELDGANQRIGEMTRLGGSQVMAYCATPSQSRNTAGASNDCATAGYGCEPVSGLCRTSCQTSDMCASGYLCDTGVQQCVRRP